MFNIRDKTNILTPVYKDSKKAHIPNIQAYKEIYDNSIKDPDRFWAEQAERLHWFEKRNTVSSNDFSNIATFCAMTSSVSFSDFGRKNL